MRTKSRRVNARLSPCFLWFYLGAQLALRSNSTKHDDIEVTTRLNFVFMLMKYQSLKIEFWCCDIFNLNLTVCNLTWKWVYLRARWIPRLKLTKKVSGSRFAQGSMDHHVERIVRRFRLKTNRYNKKKMKFSWKSHRNIRRVIEAGWINILTNSSLYVCFVVWKKSD